MSIRVDETKPDTEATEPVIPTTCSPEDLPDEEQIGRASCRERVLMSV